MKQPNIEALQRKAKSKLQKGVSAQELLRLEMLSELEKFTKAMFKACYGRSFAVNEHHRQMFKALQDVVDGKCTRLIINMPPRYSKTEVAIKQFISWCFALNPKCRFLHLSYSDLLVTDNSSTIRETMKMPLYKTLFPASALEKENGSSVRWKTQAGGEFYAVSTQGQVTGFGAGVVDTVDKESLSYEDLTFDENLDEVLEFIGAQENIFSGALIIDDPLKPESGDSDVERERVNTRFESTIRNRVNSRKTPIIIIMQRIHEHDLCGYLLDTEPEEWTVLSLPAIITDEDGNERPLWEMKHTLKELYKLRSINTHIFDTQYMQDPKPKEGLMYAEGFKTYKPEQLPTGPKAQRKWNYTDTADTGADCLCSISFIDTPEYVYITDVIFTDEPMEVTEPLTARSLATNRVVRARIESNNGGRGFARSVKRILRSDMHNFRCKVETFTQTKNKYVRIFTQSAGVVGDVLMPEDWEKRWPKFYNAIMSYRKDNKKRSQHDDAPDCLTGVYEMHIARENNVGIVRRN